MRLICEGCGQPVPIPEGYRRNKIQCACGVICPVPESARQESAMPPQTQTKPAAKPSLKAEEEAERWLLDDDPPTPTTRSEPPRFRAPESNEEPKPATKPAFERKFNCRRCGQLVRRQGECPSCDAHKMPAAKSEPVWWPSVDAPDDKNEGEEDSSPYVVEGADEVRCPQCSMMLPAGSVLCVRCGFDLKKRKKFVKTYQPIEREWETNYSLQTRLTILGTCEALALALGLIGVFVGGADLGVLAGSFVLLTAILGFLLGTFDRIQLARNERGRVQLTKTWRVCSAPCSPGRLTCATTRGLSAAGTAMSAPGTISSCSS